jgi:hypothetical protein
MTIKLIYHNLESASGGVSPFDEVISRITKGEDVRLACPYLSVSYIRHLVSRCESWRIVTDVEEWIASRSKDSRQEIQKFIIENRESIHHYKDLHAKVIVAGKSVLVGSANFTEKGITGRVEMSVLFEEEENQSEELRQWFDNLWSQTASVDITEMVAFADSLPDVRVERSRFTITSKAPRVKSKMVAEAKGRVIRGNENGHRRLVERIRLAPNREWINEYFDLVKELLSFTGLAADDPKLVLSIPSYNKLPVTINNRYVLSAAFYRQKPATTGFIFGAQSVKIPELQSKTVSGGRFDPLPGEEFDDTPYFFRFIGSPNSIFADAATNELKDEWIEAVLSEMGRCKSSSYRKFHESVLYESAVNLDYRKAVLDEAFS